MKIGLARYISVEIEKFSEIFTSIESELNNFFLRKDYGQNVKELHIGIICVSPQFEQFFQPKNVKFTRGKKYEKEGVLFSLEGVLEYDFKLDYASMISIGDEARTIIIYALLESLRELKEISSKLKFNLGDFENDMRLFSLQFSN
ncbi:MAG: hypothetical protein EOO45_02790 [Flavobacterium sp.]|nr:MAG: hypothetical protein EOO45_02790 [Flavobacterium sp.]